MILSLLAFLALHFPAAAAGNSAANPSHCAPHDDFAALTSGGLIWSYDGGQGVGFVAMSDRGGQVLAASSHGIEVFSSFDTNPPTPVGQLPPGQELYLFVARNADVYLTLDIQLVGPIETQATLRKFTSSSAVPDWSFVFPQQVFDSYVVCDVSDDGSVIVSSFVDTTLHRTEIRKHDPATGAALQSTVFPNEVAPAILQLSPDGSVVAMSTGAATGGTTRLFDLATQSFVFSTDGAVFSWAHGISEEGRVLAVVERIASEGWHVRVHARRGDHFEQVIDRISSLEVIPWQIAVSEDGSTVAAAWYRDGTPGRLIVRAFDVASATMTMERILVSPSLDNRPSDIDISADGSRFVVGSWGDGAGLAAELAVYSPTQNDPLVEYPAGGSVFAVEISPDGDRFVASRNAIHRDIGIGPVDLELYEFGGEDFVPRGRPSIGATVAFELHATPGATAFLLSSPRLAPDPIVVPGVGTLALGPSLLRAVPIGSVPPSGVAVHPLSIASDPALVGRTTFYQGLTVGPRTLTRDWVQLTVLP